MAVDFRITKYSIMSDTKIMEIVIDGAVAAVIYPNGERGVKLVSAHIKDLVHDNGDRSISPVPAVLIDFDPQPYVIRNGKIVKCAKLYGNKPAKHPKKK